MPDEGDMKAGTGANAGPEPSKKHVDLFAKLTDEDWREAMIMGQRVADARDAEIGAAIRRGCERSITEAREELDKARLALRTYLERGDSEPEDLMRHRDLAVDLKNAADNLKNATDEYAILISNRVRAR